MYWAAFEHLLHIVRAFKRTVPSVAIVYLQCLAVYGYWNHFIPSLLGPCKCDR